MNFSQGSNIDYTQSKIMKTYRSVKRRMQSRFMKNGILQAKLFLVSSKKSEQDFIESYVETVKNEPNVLVIDKAQWEIKPEGTFSDRRFKVAVGGKKLHSRIINDNEDLDSIKKQGYQIIEVPLELKKDFERDVDSSLMEFAGISASLSTKFIAYDYLVKAYGLCKNPFKNNILSIGIKDDMLIQDFFIPSLIDDELKSKPMYIHLDQSLTGDRTGISGVCVMGLRETKDYDPDTGEYIPVHELIYKHVFSIGIQCPAGSEISLEKNRKFIYYLKYSLGFNIAGVSLDGYQSADAKQQLLQAGFNASIISLDRTPDGYMYLKASINERRISLLDIPELEDELLNVERNNMTGKIDHTRDGSKDIADSLAGALFNASKNADIYSLHVLEDFNSIDSVNDNINDNGSVIENMYNDFTKPEDKSMSLNDIINDIKKKSDDYTQSRINNMRKSLTAEESSRVTDEELEDVLYNRSDDMLIW